MLTEELYRELQTLGEFDNKTSNWVATPDKNRRPGGALFCDRRLGQVLTITMALDLAAPAGDFAAD